jgi:hypothetical protein
MQNLPRSVFNANRGAAVALSGGSHTFCCLLLFCFWLASRKFGEFGRFASAKSVVYDRVVDHLLDAGIHTGLRGIAFNKSFDLRFATHGSDVEIRKHADELLAGGVMGVL